MGLCMIKKALNYVSRIYSSHTPPLYPSHCDCGSIAVLAGVIDRDYTGNIKVVLFNHSESDFNVEKGQGIAQLIIEKICTPELIELTELPETQRGAKGFGSTEHYK